MGKFNDLSHISDSRTLILPICTQTINLVEEHSGNLDLLADRLRIDRKSRNITIFAFKLDKNNGEQKSQKGFKHLPILDRKKSHRTISQSQTARSVNKSSTELALVTATNTTNETAREFYRKEIAVMEKGLITDRAKKRKMSAKSNAQLSARSNSNIAVRAKSNVFGSLSGFNTQKSSNQPTQIDR